MLALGFLTNKWTLAAVFGAAIIVIFGFLYAQNTALKRDLNAANLIIENQTEQLEFMEATLEEVNRVSSEISERLAATENFIRNRISNATDDEDGPVAPVLSDTLEFLRNR